MEKKILIAGGGIGGMELAIQLSAQGHRVILCEGKDRLGGLVRLAMLPPDKEYMADMLATREKKLAEQKVEVRLNTTVTPQLVGEIAPDYLAIATGSLPSKPPIPGSELAGTVTADELLQEGNPTGKRYCVVGGGLVGCETAQYLAAKGKEVLILEMGDAIAAAMAAPLREKLFKSLSDFSVDVRVKVALQQIALPKITLASGGYTHTLAGFDGVVLAAGRKPQNQLVAQVQEQYPNLPIALLGDAKAVGMTGTAIMDAAGLAKELANGQWGAL